MSEVDPRSVTAAAQLAVAAGKDVEADLGPLGRVGLSIA
jgi:hypothetical protein